jgi:hypothetical protein
MIKKIIACVLFFTTDVFAENISNYSSAWKVGIPYNTPVSDQSVIGKYGLATTVLIAREIYENGGKFCPTRITASSASSYENVTLYYRDNPMFTCYTICKPGYYGNTCEKSGTPSVCGNINYESVLKDKLKIDTKSDTSLSSYSINAFGAGQEFSGYGLSRVETYQLTTLGIIGYVPYGVVVAPIKVSASGMSNTVSVSTNDRTTTLCANGYKIENGACVKPENCPRIIVVHPNQNDETAWEINFCPGYENYDETKHYLVKNNTCYSYFCKKGGFDPDSNRKDCIEDCGNTKKSGVLENRDCEICLDNKIFNGESCVDYKYRLYAKDLLDGIQNIGKCWIKSSPSEYKDCVLCSKGQYWNATNKKCEIKINQ